ncbi:unnamed protein product [Sphagnum compactum]
MAGLPRNIHQAEEGEAGSGGSHHSGESYLDQILRRLQSEQESPTSSATYNTAASSAMMAAATAGSMMSSYAQRAPPGSSSFDIAAAVTAPDQGAGSGSGGSTKPWPDFIEPSYSHPARVVMSTLRKQSELVGQESEHMKNTRFDTQAAASSNFPSGDPLTSEFPWLIEDQPAEQQRGAGGNAGQLLHGAPAGLMSSMTSSSFSNSPEDDRLAVSRAHDRQFAAHQLGFRMSRPASRTPHELEVAPALDQGAARGRTTSSTPAVMIMSEPLYETPPPMLQQDQQLPHYQQGRMSLPTYSFQSAKISMPPQHMTSSIPLVKDAEADHPCGPMRSTAEIDPPAGAASSAGTMSAINQDTTTPNSSLSSGISLSTEGDDVDAERSTRSVSSRGQLHQTSTASPAEEGTSSTKRKTPEDEVGEETTKSEAGLPTELKKQPSLNRPRKKSAGMKRVREPRYSVKTRTDVDIMDDGFKWRKYGQKAVKNSPHPRNYYRCTTPSCPVRKRVERSCEDSSLVITTYEGTHAHHTPGFNRSSPSLLQAYFGEAARASAAFMGHGQHQHQLFGLPAATHMMISGSSLQQLQGGRTSSSASHGQLPLQQLPGSFLQPSFHLNNTGLALGLRAAAAAAAGQDTFVGAVKQEPFQFAASSSRTHDPQDQFLSRLASSAAGLPRIMPTQMQNTDPDAVDVMNMTSAATRAVVDSSASSSAAAYMKYQQQLTHSRRLLAGAAAAAPVSGSTSTVEAGSPQAGLPAFTGLGFNTNLLLQQQQALQQQMVTYPGLVQSGCQELQPGESSSTFGQGMGARSNPASVSNISIVGNLAAQQHQLHPEVFHGSTKLLMSMPRTQQDIRQLLELAADRQHQQQLAARLNTIYRDSSASAASGAAAAAHFITEQDLHKSSSQEYSRRPGRRATLVDQGLLEDMVRPRSCQGPPPPPRPPAASGM